MNNNLQELFVKSGLSLSEISRRSGVSYATVQRYVKNNSRTCKQELLNPILKVLKESITEGKENNINENTNESEDTNSNYINTEQIKFTINQNYFKSSTSTRNPKRGDVWYAKNLNATGSEIWGSRPCIIVSNDKLNVCMNTVEVIFLTTQPQKELPTHTTIKTNKTSVTLCEQISTISKDKLSDYLTSITDLEMKLIEKAMLTSLGIKINTNTEMYHSPDYLVLQTERNMLREFYNDVIKNKKE